MMVEMMASWGYQIIRGGQKEPEKGDKENRRKPKKKNPPPEIADPEENISAGWLLYHQFGECL